MMDGIRYPVNCEECGKLHDANAVSVTRHCGKFYCLKCAPDSVMAHEVMTSWGALNTYWRKGKKSLGVTHTPSPHAPFGGPR